MTEDSAGEIPLFNHCYCLPDYNTYGPSNSNARPKDETAPGGYFNKISRWRDFTIMMKQNGVWFPQATYLKDSEGWEEISLKYNY